MKLTLSKLPLEKTPKAYLRVRLTAEARGTKRLVREEGAEWLEFGAGEPKELSMRRFIVLCRSIVRAAKNGKAKKIAIQFDATPKLFARLSQEATPEEISQRAAEAFVMAELEFTNLKKAPKEGWPRIEETLLCGKSSKTIEAAVRKGQAVGESVNLARILANAPSSDMPPKALAKATKDAMKGLPVSVRALGRAEMTKLGMGAVLGVGKGSSQEPMFIVMEYKGGKGAPIVLAGKGVTFDSGGINLKPDGGHEMHMDMSGGAAVIGAVQAIARLKLKKHVVGLVPAVENMPGPSAYRVHDVLKSLSGKTIEIVNTDAEGRVILADALAYAKRYKPSAVIDVATLTGACMVALGTYANGLFSKDDALADALLVEGERSGDYLWRLPLWDEYEAGVKGTIGDVANASTGPNPRYGGAINAAMFLWQFAKDLECPWAHLDIAPRMTANADEQLAKGAAGSPVRLLVSFIESWKG